MVARAGAEVPAPLRIIKETRVRWTRAIDLSHAIPVRDARRERMLEQL
jgi:hypothetical protein